MKLPVISTISFILNLLALIIMIFWFDIGEHWKLFTAVSFCTGYSLCDVIQELRISLLNQTIKNWHDAYHGLK